MNHPQVEQRISDLAAALNRYPQGRLFQLLKYTLFACNLFILGILLLLFYVVFFVPKPTPEQVVTFLKFAVIFLLFYLPISYLQRTQQEIMNRWSKDVIKTAIVICSSGQFITIKQMDRLYALMNSKEKELDLAFGGCDEPTRVVHQRLWTMASPD